MTKPSSNADKGVTRDWRATLFLPKTDFPMKAGLPKLEPQIIDRWRRIGLFGKLRADSKGRDKFILHDGPPYANGHLHIGHALNKILKDLVNRSQQMLGKDANYVPGWDCHGLPIEWKIEEQYRAKGKSKDEVPINEFRRECREFAEHWIEVQREEFIRLGVEGDWQKPYTTMSFDAEAKIAGELMKFAMSGRLYRGSKPVMWSVVERTALAEAEVEYHEIQSDTIWVKFPVRAYSGPAIEVGEDESVVLPEALQNASIVIWTTTPWTIPGNRAISFSQDIDYGLYEVIAAPDDNWAKVGDKLVLADALAKEVMSQARVESFERLGDVTAEELARIGCRHPLEELGYHFNVPLFDGEHVTADTGTGFVHTAPGHGREDFDIWTANDALLRERGIDTAVPFTVDEAGFFTRDAPGFDGGRVIDDNGKWGDANKRVIEALVEAGTLIARGRLRHDYPHSWRSKKPIIFRATPQWFVPMEDDKGADGLRGKALAAIDATRFYPPAGQNRLRGMIESRPDWVISRQRAWGVPITVFEHKETGEVLPNAGFNGAGALIERITKAFAEEGADAWFADGAEARFLDGIVADPNEWEQVTDILDVWFDSGSTHAFVLEERDDLKWPADLYLEGSDQHRGWFHSSLLESCGTRGRAPYDAVLTHGFILDEKGDEKMSKSKGNALAPQAVTKQYGAEILRLWVASSDFSNDIRFGPQLLQANTDSYRKLRNTLRFMLGNLHHFDPALTVPAKEMPELERYMLHLVRDLDQFVRRSYENFEFGRVFHALFNFCTVDLSAFYFDIRKDALYCDPHDSPTRRACLTVLDVLHARLTAWLAPVLCFTCEEAWLARFPGEEGSVHLRRFPETPDDWSDEALADRWRKLRLVRRAVTGALEIERKEKRIGSSLEAAPDVYIEDSGLHEICASADMADLCITSQLRLHRGAAPDGAFLHADVPGVAVIPGRAEGRKCARSWKILPDVGTDPDYPDLSPRDAEAVRQFEAMSQAAQ